MNYTRLTSGLPGAFRRDGKGGFISTLLLIGVAVAAFIFLPSGDLWIGNLWESKPQIITPATIPGQPFGGIHPTSPEASRPPPQPQIVDDDLTDFEERRRNVTSRAVLAPETYAPVSKDILPNSSVKSYGNNAQVRSAERVKGYPSGPDIFYVIPDWAGSTPGKALARLRGDARYHTQFKVAGKPYIQVGYGKFDSWEDGEAFRIELGLERSPRAFRWVD